MFWLVYRDESGGVISMCLVSSEGVGKGGWHRMDGWVT